MCFGGGGGDNQSSNDNGPGSSFGSPFGGGSPNNLSGGGSKPSRPSGNENVTRPSGWNAGIDKSPYVGGGGSIDDGGNYVPSPDPISQALGGDARSFVGRAMPEPATPADRHGAKSAPAAAAPDELAAPAELAAIPGVGSVPLPPTRPDRTAREARRARGVAEGVIGLPELNAPMPQTPEAIDAAVGDIQAMIDAKGRGDIPMPDNVITPDMYGVPEGQFATVDDYVSQITNSALLNQAANGIAPAVGELGRRHGGYGDLRQALEDEYTAMSNQAPPAALTDYWDSAIDGLKAQVDANDWDNTAAEDLFEGVARAIPGVGTIVGTFPELDPEWDGRYDSMKEAYLDGVRPEPYAPYGVDLVPGALALTGALGAPGVMTAAAGIANSRMGNPLAMRPEFGKDGAVFGTPDPVGWINIDNPFNMSLRNPGERIYEDRFGNLPEESKSARPAGSRSYSSGGGESDSDLGSYNEPAPSYGSADPAPPAPPPAPPPEPALQPPSSWKRWAGAPHPERTGESRNINAFGYEDEFFATGPGGYLPYRGYLDPAHPVNTEETKWYRDQGIASLYGMHPEHYFYPNQRGPMA